MSSIYRKYRPQAFQEVVGQSHIKLALEYQLQKNSFTHAYLFCGPRGLGKTTIARLLAKAVNCEKRSEGEFEPCNKCDACVEITQGSSMDILEIDAASHTGVDNVRENIIENVRFTTNKRKFKVFIIDEVHMLSISAFNALLKTLEEPPEYTIFILCTTEIHKVPETIISRCQRFDFKKVTAKEMIARLKKIAQQEKVKIEDKVFEVIAAKSGGCMRDAESLLGQILSLGEQKISYQEVKSILPSSEIGAMINLISLITDNQVKQAVSYLNQLVDDGVDLEVLGEGLIEFLRKLILIKLDVLKEKDLDWTAEEKGEVKDILNELELGQIALMIKSFLQALNESKNSPILQLPWELALVRMYQYNQSREGGKQNKFEGPNHNQKNSGGIGLKDKINNILNNKNLKNGDEKDRKQDQAQKIEEGASKASINFEQIKSIWPKIISLSRQKNLDLMFISEKMIWPVSIKGNKLVVGFKYDLHKVRFEKDKSINSFKEAVKEAIGQPMEITTKTLKPSELVELEIKEEQKAAEKEELSGVKVTEENILDVVLQSFGGEVIEKSSN